MVTALTRSTIWLGSSLFIFSLVALGVNAYSYHYPGNNYFPPHTFFIACSLALMYVGFCLQFGRENTFAILLQEIIYFFFIMALIALATNAVQYTPFPVIDQIILDFETTLSIDLKLVLSWTHEHPKLVQLLAFIYNSLPFQMVYFPLIIIVTKKLPYIREYYFLLLISTLFGFGFYYFFPTTGPASIIDSPYFSEIQRATGLKYAQIHNHIPPSTLEGGMIALPSFHVIWAWFCLYLLRPWPLAFYIMLPINILLVASCVLLGWHYPIDILGGLIFILVSHGFYIMCQTKWEKNLRFNLSLSR